MQDLQKKKANEVILLSVGFREKEQEAEDSKRALEASIQKFQVGNGFIVEEFCSKCLELKAIYEREMIHHEAEMKKIHEMKKQAEKSKKTIEENMKVIRATMHSH